MTITHDLIGGKLHVYRRENSRFWQCSSYLAGRNHRATTKTDNVERAKAFAEEWYFGLHLQHRAGELRGGKSVQAAADQFLREYEALTAGERNPKYVKSHGDRLRVHLLPFFGNKSVSDITPGLVQEYRIHRTTSRKDEKTGLARRPARSTLHHEIVTLRHVLKTAQRHGWVKFIPDLSPPYKASGKIGHRAWFSPEEYKQLYEATRRRVRNPPNPRWKWQCEQLHDYVLFMVNTGLRPDEASRLEYRDVEVAKMPGFDESILEISVRGKRGVGYCKSMPGAVLPFERLKKRNKPGPTDRLFPKTHRQLLNDVLEEEGLKKDREGLPRTAYSLRHTYICLRLMEGADIYQIAKNCRTSVEMIEKFYAAHIKNMIDAAAVNVRRAATPAAPKKRPNGRSPKGAANAKRPRIRRK
jgi:integrase